MNAGGATACAMIQQAAEAIDAGICHTVACVFSDAPLKPPKPKVDGKGNGGGSAGAYGFARGLDAAYGQFGVNAMYAMVAQRHMHLYGTTNDHLGAIAVAERQWANRNPAAQFHDTPMTIEDYHRSRWVVEPFHLFDCCLVSNGGLAVIVTARSAPATSSSRRSTSGAWGRGIPAAIRPRRSPRARCWPRRSAFTMAGITLQDIDVVELYDCYTFTVLVCLEDYGFCKKGEGGPFVADGKTAPGRRAAGQHRRRPAVVVLHVGHDAGLRRRDPAARRRRRATGAETPSSPWSAATAASSRRTRRWCCPRNREAYREA